MSKTYDQIYAELGSVYDPQANVLRQQQQGIPEQIKYQENELGRAKDNAFEDIMGAARRRGAGFSGMPIQEQARYTGGYLDQLGKLRSEGRQQATSLEQAILGINERRSQQAQGQYQYERSLAEQQRQFNEQQAAQQRALGMSGGGGFAPTLGGGGGAPPPAADPWANVNQQGATNAMKGLFETKNVNTIRNTINAITQSANKGNMYDKFKLELLKQYQTNSPYASLINQAMKNNQLSVGVAQPQQRLTVR